MSSKDKPVFLVVGKLRKPHGFKGEWQMDAITHFPERLKRGKTVFLGEEKLPAVIDSIRGHVNRMLVQFKDAWDEDMILRMRNQFVYIKTEDLPPLPKDLFYHHEILGMKVQDEEGKNIGTIDDIVETGANDVYVIQCDGKEILIPAITSVILRIDKSNRVMVVKLPEWI